MKRTTTALKISWLIFTAVVTVATSKVDDKAKTDTKEMSYGQYLVASNCPNSTNQQQIETLNASIIVPQNITFQNFGLPQAKVNIGENVSGEIFGVQRNCVYSLYQAEPEDLHLYTCYQNNMQVCQVTFE